MANVNSGLRSQDAFRRTYTESQICPTCSQPIPNDRAQEILERYNAKEHAQAEALERQVNERLARERPQVESNAMAVAEAAAHEKLVEAQKRVESLEENIEDAVAQRVQVMGEVIQKDKTDTINKLKNEHLAQTLKLTNTVQNLQRQLDQRNAQQLGEGPEVNLFEDLKDAFEYDRITRVPHGAAGADIHHVVMHNGKECGTMVYDSKNRSVWRDDYVTKLRADQITAKAAHAILSTCKFPAGTEQVTEREGVIIAYPARVPTLAGICRRQIIQMSSLRMAGKERDDKTARLYSYFTSELFGQRLKSIEDFADKVLDIDANERKVHESVWKKRGRLITALLESHGDLCADIERIIGTADAD